MQLHKAFGGDCDFEYDHSKFWPELTRLTGEKRAQFVARWNASGSEIGASEFELKGGENEGMAALSINSRSLGLIVE